MAIKSFRPTTPSRRFMTVTDYSDLSDVKPEKSLLKKVKKNAGRNSYGRITVRHRGGGNRRKYRVIDFKRDKIDMEAVVQTLEYDPNRSANIALVKYADGEVRYIVAPLGLKVGDTVAKMKQLYGTNYKYYDNNCYDYQQGAAHITVYGADATVSSDSDGSIIGFISVNNGTLGD